MSRRFETFSFLPPLSANQIEMQASSMLKKGHVPVIEFADTPSNEDTYWQMWQLQNNGKEITPQWLNSQIEACRRRFPYAYVRLSGYDTTKQYYASSFIVRTPVEA